MLREYMNAMQVPVCWDSDVEDREREREKVPVGEVSTTEKWPTNSDQGRKRKAIL